MKTGQIILILSAVGISAGLMYYVNQRTKAEQEANAVALTEVVLDAEPVAVELAPDVQMIPEVNSAVGEIAPVVTKQSLDSIISTSSKPVAVKVFSQSCGPCHVMKPLFAQVAQELGDKMTFVEVDIDAFDGQEALSIEGVPTIIIYKNGAEVGRLVGGREKDVLKAELEKLA